MTRRPGPDEGQYEHPAAAGGSRPGEDGPAGGPSHDAASGRDAFDEVLADPDGDPRLAAFLDRSAQVLQTEPDELTAHRHLAAVRRGAGGAGAAPEAPGRRSILRLASIGAAAAVTAVVTLATFGALPAPAQQVLSDVADRVGITIPSPADEEVPSSGTPAKQPALESVPGRAGGSDRSELPGRNADGSLHSPGSSNATTPPDRSAGQPEPDTDRRADPDRDEDPGPLEGSPAPEAPPVGEEPPGESASPPGQSGSAPGKPEDPPGQSESPPDPSEGPPGRTGEAPGPPGSSPGPPKDDEPPASKQGSDVPGDGGGSGDADGDPDGEDDPPADGVGRP